MSAVVTPAVELLPCPFCGGEAAIADNTGPKLCTAPHAYVFCKKFGCPGREHEADTVAEAITAWNQRHRSEAVEELVEVLERILSDEDVALSRPDYELARTLISKHRGEQG